MKKTVMQKYARLLARKGLGIRKGQEVIITAGLDQPDFVRMCVEECYRAGAAKVTVDWSYQPITKVNYRYRTVTNLSHIEKWELERMEHRVEALPALLYIESEDPDGLKGINQEKVTKSQQARYKLLKPYRDRMENKYQWCIAAVPGKAWAKKVFPDLKVNQAMEKLWEAILFTSRADGEDPIAAWDAHNADLKSRCEYLNALGIRTLRYHSANGTDFKVGLMPESMFCAGAETSLKGVTFNPNIPSEEVFTSPKRGEAEGWVVSTRPLSYRGEMIEGFAIRFEGGRAVEVKAEKNEELLRTMIGMDEGASYLGECALVPYASPIRESGITFYNTLFDENACCHLALGRGFPDCVRGYENLTLEQCREKGLNDSIIHVDFMIGSEDLHIEADCADGKTVVLFDQGNWAF